MSLRRVLYIIGCGGHARSVADIALDNEPDLQCIFFDGNAKPDETIMGMLVLPLDDLKMKRDMGCIVAVGDNATRELLYRRFAETNVVSVISKNAHIGMHAAIGRGSFVGNNAHIGPAAAVGENCIINTGAIVEHECVIGSHTHVSVGAKVCGRSRIGLRCMIGAGATVIDKVSICDDVVVGAGAVVIGDITEKGTYVGVPARKTG